MRSFATIVRGSSGLEEMAFALSYELGHEPLRGSRAQLARLAGDVAASGGPLERLESLCAVVASAFEPRSNGPLLPSRILMRGGGHPDAIAVVALAIAERASLAVGMVTDGEHLYLAHKGSLALPLIADFSGPARLIDGATLGADLHWQCSHQAAFVILRRVAARSDRSGDLTTAVKAIALVLDLPLSDEVRSAYELRRRRLQARFN